MKRYYWGLIATAAIAACGKSGSDTSQASPTPTASPSEAAAPDRKDLPAKIQNDAYRYYGLSNPKPVAYTLKIGTQANAQTMTGTAETTLKSIGPDSAMFEVKYTDQLESTLGTSVIELTKNGVFVRESSLGKVKSDQMEMPNNLAPGTEWKSTSQIEPTSGPAIATDVKYRVVGVQSVTTPAGKFQALLITGVGTTQTEATKAKCTFRGWYVKDHGLVCQEMSLKTPNEPERTITLVERPSK